MTNFINKFNSVLKNAQTLSNNALKFIALITMFIDHSAKVLLVYCLYNILAPQMNQAMISVEEYESASNFIVYYMPMIGRMAFPIFCFLLVEGFTHTKNRKKYLFLLTIFAFISEIPFDMAFFHSLSSTNINFPFYFNYQNVYFTLALGMLMMIIIDSIKQKYLKLHKENTGLILQFLTILAIAYIAELIKCDYGYIGIFYIATFYLFKSNRLLQVLSMLIIYFATTSIPPISIWFTAVIILLYNGQHGKLRLKYLFYVFYPTHLILLYVLAIISGAVVIP